MQIRLFFRKTVGSNNSFTVIENISSFEITKFEFMERVHGKSTLWPMGKINTVVTP